MSRTLCLAGAVLFCGALVLHAQQEPPRPEFRAGTDIVTLDVVVLDKDRKPVRGLTVADFVVTEQRDRQEIVSFSEVTMPSPDRALAPWTRDIGPDVVDNDVAGRRLVVMILDDANGSLGYQDNALALTRRTGHAIVDQLGPADLGAVVYTFLGRVQNLTADKRQLHAAVEDYVPRNGTITGPPLGCVLRLPGVRNTLDGSGCQIESLTRVAEVLRTAPPGRKMVAFISPGIKMPPAELSNPDGMTALPFLKKMFETLQAANASVYEIDPRGLPLSADLSTKVSLSSATGGRHVQNTNAPERIVPAIFEENSAYYLIGYRSTHTRTDGLYRGQKVTVNRPDVQVVARSGYYGPTKASTKPSNKPEPKPVDAALAGGTFATDLRLGVNAAVFAVPGRSEADVVATILVTDPIGTEAGAPETHDVELLSVAYDTGWRSKVSHRQTIAIARVPGIDDPAKYELTTRFALKPGRYELRFAAEVGGRTGSVFLSLDVPNFAKESLSLSGLVVVKSFDGRIARGVSVGDLPVVPTANRTFTRQDPPVVYMRVYQGGSKPVAPVSMQAEVRDSHDRVVWTETSLVAPGDFTAARSADYRVSLPPGRFEPGEHLLTVTAGRDDENRLERTVRFHVE
jgi:VWFA-related protein